MLTLLVLQGPDKGQRFELPDAATVIGRVGGGAGGGGGGGVEIALSDNTVSRRHCEIGNRDGIHLLKDLGSANGTYVNGLKVKTPQAVRVGDQLRVGRTLMAIGSTPGFSVPSSGGGVEFAGAESGMDSAIMHTVEPGGGANDESLVLAVPEPTAGAVANLQVLYKLGAALGASFDAGQAMGITLDLIFEHVKPERGMILLKEEKSGQLEAVVVRTREGELAVGERLHASQTIIDHVLRTGHGVLSQNAMEDKRFSSGKSVHSLAIRSALCVPILGRPPRQDGAGDGEPGEILGIIYIDSSKRNYTYSPDQLRLLGAIGLQAGMAVQSAKLYQAAIRAERLAAVGETTAALAHAIKNILQAMRGGADVVEMGLSRKDLVQAGKGWGVVSRSLTRILGVTQNLLAYSKPRTPRLERVDVGALVKECVELIAERAAERGVMVLADEPAAAARPPKVSMDEDAMHQVIMNLLGNAVDAVGEKRGGLVRVKTGLERAGGAGGGGGGGAGGEEEVALIEVADNGPGVEKALGPHLFELFQSTKGNRGTGLGLAVSKKIVEEHDGEISYSKGGELGGAVFTVRLPVREMEGEG